MKAKNGTRLFLCEITGQRLILAVLACEKNNRRRFTDLQIQALAGDSVEQCSRQLQDMLKGKRYAREPVVLTVPHKYATSRFMRIPASSDDEIEKIVSLQASRLLPASSDDLVTGFQVISRDKDGYCRVNLIIVQKAIIDRYCTLLRQAGVRDFSITLSSEGLFNLCEPLRQRGPGITALVEIDELQAEICFCSKDALMFSRSLPLAEGWQDGKALSGEYRKTEESFLKENSAGRPETILLAGPPALYPRLEGMAPLSAGVRQEPFRYWEGITVSETFMDALKETPVSCASLIGTGLKDVPASMDFIPAELKNLKKSGGSRNALVTAGIFILSSCLVLGAAFHRELSAKEKIMAGLSKELSAIEKDARKIEGLEKKYGGLALAGNSCLRQLTELHQLVPAGIRLSAFIYEGQGQVTLRGQAQELNQVLELASKIEASPGFKGYGAKIKYTTQKRGTDADRVDFEIGCQPK